MPWASLFFRDTRNRRRCRDHHVTGRPMDGADNRPVNGRDPFRSQNCYTIRCRFPRRRSKSQRHCRDGRNPTASASFLGDSPYRHQPPGTPAVPRDDGRLPPTPRRTDWRRYVNFVQRMVSQLDPDRNRPSPPGPPPERRASRRFPLRERHNRRFIGRPETFE